MEGLGIGIGIGIGKYRDLGKSLGIGIGIGTEYRDFFIFAILQVYLLLGTSYDTLMSVLCLAMQVFYWGCTYICDNKAK